MKSVRRSPKFSTEPAWRLMKAWDEVSSLVRSGLLDPVQSRRTAISPSESSFSMAPISMRSWVRRRSERRPMMPKSMKPMRFPGITSMLPGCGSAWNTPSISAMLRKASVPFWATLTLSIPAASRRGWSLGGMPWMNSWTRTRSEVNSQWILGMTMSSGSAKIAAMVSQLRASLTRSSSP